MKTSRQNGNREESEPEVSPPSGNGSGFATAHGSQSIDTERPGSSGLADDKRSSSALVRRATGPRTPPGKERSKHNALKHGILSSVVLLKDESQSEFDSLLSGLRENLQPEGTLEEVLVEKLAILVWRHRRLLGAESAEIRKNMEFVEWDQRNRQREEAEEIGGLSAFQGRHGLIRKIYNPDVLECCLELLAELRQKIAEGGFDRERDTVILRRIYGDRDESHLREDLYDSYGLWLATSEVSEEEGEREGYASPAQCRKNVLQEIDEDVRHLKRYQKTRMSIEADRTHLEIVRRSVPDAPVLDRLLKYEASLERAFDRTLSQLERLQRIRLGQPVPPAVHVNLSS